VTGSTYSTNLLPGNSCQASRSSGEDIFVTRLDSIGSFLLYSTCLGGSDGDIPPV